MRHTYLTRRVPALVAALAAALVLAGCSSGSSTGSATAAENAASVQGGAGALDFAGATLEGKQLDAASLAGQPVVLWFWAPWCTVCRAEAPDVAAVAAEFDGQVTFVGIPGLGPEDDMRRFVDETGTEGFAHVVDGDGGLWARFGVVSQPAFVFVAADGTAESFMGSLPADQLRQRASALVRG